LKRGLLARRITVAIAVLVRAVPRIDRVPLALAPHSTLVGRDAVMRDVGP
jgi:hypothetical protein